MRKYIKNGCHGTKKSKKKKEEIESAIEVYENGEVEDFDEYVDFEFSQVVTITDDYDAEFDEPGFDEAVEAILDDQWGSYQYHQYVSPEGLRYAEAFETQVYDTIKNDILDVVELYTMNDGWEPGDYLIEGTFHLAYEVSGLYHDADEFGYDDIVDDMKVKFRPKQSRVDHLSVTRI